MTTTRNIIFKKLYVEINYHHVEVNFEILWPNEVYFNTKSIDYFRKKKKRRKVGRLFNSLRKVDIIWFFFFFRPINETTINQKSVTNDSNVTTEVSPASRGSFRTYEKIRKLVPQMGVIFIFSPIYDSSSTLFQLSRES